MADATKTPVTAANATSRVPDATEPEPEKRVDPLAGLIEGRIVHFVFADRQGELVHRPAVVVRVGDRASGLVNLRVFTDGANDAPYGDHTLWATSVRYSEEPQDQTWHWIERA